MSSDAKFRFQADNLLLELCTWLVFAIPKMFYLKRNERLLKLLAKIVDDILATGNSEFLCKGVDGFHKNSNLAQFFRASAVYCTSDLILCSAVTWKVLLDVDDKLQSLEPYLLSRSLWREVDPERNAVERSAFALLNSCSGWIDTTVSPLCLAAASGFNNTSQT